jgi:hypothetical protein
MPRHKVDYDYDFFLVGVSCHEKDYRFVWSVNQALGADFSRAQSLEIKEKSQKGNFQVFHFADEEMHADYYIVQNKNETGILVPEKKTADYLLLVKGDLYDELKEKIISRIKTIKQVLTAFEIFPAELKSKQHLIF